MEWESLDTLRSASLCVWVQIKRSPPPSTVTFWRETSDVKRPKVTENNPSDGTVSVETEGEIICEITAQQQQEERYQVIT